MPGQKHPKAIKGCAPVPRLLSETLVGKRGAAVCNMPRARGGGASWLRTLPTKVLALLGTR